MRGKEDTYRNSRPSNIWHKEKHLYLKRLQEKHWPQESASFYLEQKCQESAFSDQATGACCRCALDKCSLSVQAPSTEQAPTADGDPVSPSSTPRLSKAFVHQGEKRAAPQTPNALISYLDQHTCVTSQTFQFHQPAGAAPLTAFGCLLWTWSQAGQRLHSTFCISVPFLAHRDVYLVFESR